MSLKILGSDGRPRPLVHERKTRKARAHFNNKFNNRQLKVEKKRPNRHMPDIISKLQKNVTHEEYLQRMLVF